MITRWLIGGLLLLSAGAVYFVYIHWSEPEVVAEPTVSTATSTSSAPTVPAGMREYRSELYGFSLLYPETLQVREFDEGSGASTIIFQDVKEGKGFQIFAVPYFEEQITEERFLRDIPSGVRTNSEEVTVDGAKGAAFYSKDLALGETREVWFIHNHYLFELTTPKKLEADLLKILQSWQFI